MAQFILSKVNTVLIKTVFFFRRAMLAQIFAFLLSGGRSFHILIKNLGRSVPRRVRSIREKLHELV